MACCAFAVMILMQLLAPVLWLKQRFRPQTRRNAAASWRLQPAFAGNVPGNPRGGLAGDLPGDLPGGLPGGASMVGGRATHAAAAWQRWRPRRWFAALVALELAVLLGAGSFFLDDGPLAPETAAEQTWTDEEIWYEAMHGAWCRAFDLDRAAG